MLSCSLRFETSSAAEARRMVEAALIKNELDALHDVALLCVSELVTNAVRHAKPPIELLLHLNEEGLRIEVSDADAQLPEVRRPSVHDEGGRGLMLVDVLSEAWGAELTPNGKIVWFVLSRPPS